MDIRLFSLKNGHADEAYQDYRHFCEETVIMRTVPP
jgi:hypothetical protein